MKLRVYLDTSVFSALYDERITDRQAATEEFWTKIGEYDLSTSELAREELEKTPDPVQRAKFIDLLAGISIHPLTPEMRKLTERYIDSGTFTVMMHGDALHVAAAVLSRQDILLSWNFKHLVNRRRRAKINELNISLGLPTIEIVAPPEI